MVNVVINEYDIDDQRLTIKQCWSWFYMNYLCLSAVKRRFPIIRWLPGYEFDEFKGDVIAGLSVTFTLIPQVLGLALVANLPITYGLYSSIFASFAYAIFGSCKDCNIGPTAIQAMLTGVYVAKGDIHYAGLLSFIGGVVQVIIGLLSLDFLVDFVSYPVISAFMNAGCIAIILSQLPGFFGIPKYTSGPPIPVLNFYEIVANLGELNVFDTLLGCICIVFLFTIKFTGDYANSWKYKVTSSDDMLPMNKERKRLFLRAFKMMKKLKETERLKIFLHWISIARILLLVAICTLISYCLRDYSLFTLTSNMKPGLPNFEPPQFIRHIKEKKDGTVTEHLMNFSEILHQLTPGWFVIPFLSILTAISDSKALAQFSHNPIPHRILHDTISVQYFDLSQEILTLGIANLFGSFVNSIPVAHSLNRSMIGKTSGVKTQFNAIIIGLMVLIALSHTFISAFHYIPLTTLSSVTICAISLIVKPKDIVLFYRTSLIDFILYIITFVLTVTAGLIIGVLTSIMISIIVLLAKVTRPHIDSYFTHTPIEEEKQHFGFPYVVLKPSQNIHFPAVDYLSKRAIDTFPTLSELESMRVRVYDDSVRNDTKFVVVIDGEHIFQSDSTFVKGMKDFILTVKQKGIRVIFHRIRYPVRKPLQATLSEIGIVFHHSKTEDELFKSINAAFGFPAPLLGRQLRFSKPVP